MGSVCWAKASSVKDTTHEYYMRNHNKRTPEADRSMLGSGLYPCSAVLFFLPIYEILCVCKGIEMYLYILITIIRLRNETFNMQIYQEMFLPKGAIFI